MNLDEIECLALQEFWPLVDTGLRRRDRPFPGVRRADHGGRTLGKLDRPLFRRSRDQIHFGENLPSDDGATVRPVSDESRLTSEAKACGRGRRRPAPRAASPGRRTRR